MLKRILVHLIQFLLPLILIASLVVRLLQVSTTPASLYWEEVALGYDAYSIAQTGKDHHGNAFPIVAFSSFGDYKPSGYFYILVPFVSLFGLTPLAVRLPSVLAGTASVFILYLIAKKLYSSPVALLAAGIFAVQPWNFHFSRGGFEVNVALLFVMLGTWFLVKIKDSMVWLIPSAIFFIASMYTYHAARLFSPLFAGLISLIFLIRYHFTMHARQILYLGIAGVLSVILLFPLLHSFQSEQVQSRFSTTTVFTQLDPIVLSNEAIERHTSLPFARFIYHRYWYFLRVVMQQYVTFFSPAFLFWKGDGNLRHSTGMYGLLYPVQALLIVIALLHGIRMRDNRLLLIALYIAMAALPGALVASVPHALRFLFAAPAFSLLSAIGLYTLVQMNKRLGVVVVLSFGICMGLYFMDYFGAYRNRSAQDWMYGYKEVFTSLSRYREGDERVFVSRRYGRPAMYYAFFTPIDPRSIQVHASEWKKDPYQLEFLQIGSYYFDDTVSGGAGLFATPPDHVPLDPAVSILDEIKGLNNDTIWVVWRR